MILQPYKNGQAVFGSGDFSIREVTVAQREFLDRSVTHVEVTEDGKQARMHFKGGYCGPWFAVQNRLTFETVTKGMFQ